MPNASAGMLSVRPHLAGTASGLGSAFMIGGGAILSAFAGSVIHGENASLKLLAIMITTLFFGLLAILYVMWREQQVERVG